MRELVERTLFICFHAEHAKLWELIQIVESPKGTLYRPKDEQGFLRDEVLSVTEGRERSTGAMALNLSNGIHVYVPVTTFELPN